MGLSSKQVSGDGLEWSQGLFKDGEVEIAKPQPPTVQARQQRQVTGVAPPPLRCPRCDSNNTKFCYYNNYSRSQPRHFCKSCRRHWTNGGTLRNVPVGGGRKNKRLKTSHTSSTSNVITDDGKQQQEQQVPMPFVPDHLQICQTLLHPSTSPPSSEYLTTNIGGSNGSSILGSLLSLPPMAPLAMTDPFYTSSYSFLPFMRNQLDDSSEEQDKINGLTSSSSMVDVGVGGLFQSTLLPTCSFANGNVLEPSSAGEYWNCWDELAGFGTPQPNGLPDLGRI